jgi:zinc and cadmium transporter
MPLLLLVMLCAAFGGIASAAFAVVFLWISPERSARLLPHFISLATGALLGAALIALLPEAIERAGPQGADRIGWSLAGGFLLFFVIEKVVLWWHARAQAEAGADPGARAATADLGGRLAHDHARERASGLLVIVGDSLHNALDGVLIAAAFLTSVSIGVVATVAVAAHEIPHRVADFAILVQSGLSRPRALAVNLATGLTSILGALVAYLGLREVLGVLPYALAFAAAGFLYIAVGGLIPGLHRRSDALTSAFQVALIAAGIALIACTEELAHLVGS